MNSSSQRPQFGELGKFGELGQELGKYGELGPELGKLGPDLDLYLI